jgi:hypothetical protein
MFTSAGLPDWPDLGIVGTGGILGALVGRAAAWALGYDADKGMRWGVDGGYWGSAIALGVYLVVNFLKAGVL